MTYVLYELETGRAHSQSSVSFDNPDAAKWGIKETVLSGIWNESTLDFEPVPVSRKITPFQFMGLFTDAEFDGILTAAKSVVSLERYIMKVKASPFIDLNGQPTIDGINALVTAGLLTTDRATVILNG